MNNIRIGFGYDVHAFAKERELWLGGIKIEHSKGLLGHSDADVLIHSICDAILGSANLRDIGYHFPDNREQFKNIDSKILLKSVLEILRKNGYELGNIDCTVCAEEPKINPHIEQMQQCLAQAMCTDANNISIKATTSENMGFVGRKEGISSYCVALVYKI